MLGGKFEVLPVRLEGQTDDELELLELNAELLPTILDPGCMLCPWLLLERERPDGFDAQPMEPILEAAEELVLAQGLESIDGSVELEVLHGLQLVWRLAVLVVFVESCD